MENENIKNAQRQMTSVYLNTQERIEAAKVYAHLALVEELKRFNDWLQDQSKIGGVLRK